MTDATSPSLWDRFDPKIDRSGGPDACWIWTGCLVPAGYGQIWWNGRMVNAHRVAYELETGIDPGDLHVMHRCDNRPCVNPAHLTLGSHRDNMDDRDAKNRTLKGENHPLAKVTEAQVVEIRRRRKAGERCKDLAAEFGLTSTAIGIMCRRQSWAHVPDEP